MKKAILYIHGQGGSFAEAEQFKKNCDGYDVIGVDYDVDYPWKVIGTIKAAYDKAVDKYSSVAIIANSIGAYFSMLALQSVSVEKALFISPILDMEKLIRDMMNRANVTEEELCEKKQIVTDAGETLTWDYLQYSINNPVVWNVSTSILYADRDNITALSTVENFAHKYNAEVTVMQDGEHWFHTPKQLAFLDEWMRSALN